MFHTLGWWARVAPFAAFVFFNIFVCRIAKSATLDEKEATRWETSVSASGLKSTGYFLRDNYLQDTLSTIVRVQWLMTDEEYACRNEAVMWPGWLWEIALDVLVEVGARIVRKQLGLTIGEDVKDAIRDCGSGEVIDCVQNVIDVLRVFFPGLKLIDLSLEAIEFSDKAGKVWKAVDKLQQFGEEFTIKAITLVKNKTGNLIDSFGWKNAQNGIEIFNIGNPQHFWNDFKSLFPDISGPYPNPQNPETYKVLSNTIQIEYYPVSGTSGGPTIKVKSSNGHTIKIRLQ